MGAGLCGQEFGVLASEVHRGMGSEWNIVPQPCRILALCGGAQWKEASTGRAQVSAVPSECHQDFFREDAQKETPDATSPVVQWLRFHASSSGVRV